MVQLIVGNKGKGKTKHLLEKVNLQDVYKRQAFPFAWQIPLPALSDACDSTGDHLYSFGNTDPVSADPYDQRKTGWNRKKERGRFCLNR